MKKIVFICLLGLIGSCGFVRNEAVFGKYHLIAVDSRNELCLGYEVNNTGNYVCIIPAQILAYAKAGKGKYILIKQKPHRPDTGGNTNYYIVPVLKGKFTVFPEDSIIGPLKRHDFDSLTTKLHLGKWAFKNLDK